MPRPAQYEEYDLGGAELDQPHRRRQEEEEYVPPYVPILNFEALNISNELLQQLNAAKKMLHIAEYDNSVPLNQKAQTVNSITTILQNIAKTQLDVYNAERLKKLEGVLIETLKEFPSLKKSFMARFEDKLEDEEEAPDVQ